MEITPSATDPAVQQLLEAVRMGEYQKIRRLLAQGVDVNAANPRGVNALMIAAHEGLPETLRLLLEAGASVSSYDDAGDTSLHWAVDLNDSPPDCICIELLLEAGADIGAQNQKFETALLKCVETAVVYEGTYGGTQDYSHAMALLIERGADVTIGNQNQVSLRDIMTNNPQAFDQDPLRATLAAIDRKLLETKTNTTLSSSPSRRI